MNEEVFREYLEICIQGVNYLKEKKVLLDDMGSAYEAYLKTNWVKAGTN